MLNTLAKAISKDNSGAFYLSNDFEASYADLAAATEAAGVQLRNAGVESGAAVTIIGDFSFYSIAALVALILNGNIVIPHTRKSLQRHAEEVALLKPAFEIDACTADLAIVAFPGDVPSPLNGVLPDKEPGLIVFTSGTSGRPKAIVHNVLTLLEKFASRQSRKVRAIPFLLFDHMGGFNTLLSILLGQGSIVFSEDRGVEAICACVEKFKVDLLPTTPTFLSMLLVSGAYKRFDLSSLRIVTYGTEVMSEALLKHLVKVLPDVRFKQTYGLSEIGVLMTSSQANDNTWVKLLGDDIETRVDDGILWVKVPSVMIGRVIYSESDAIFEPHVSDWFCTGDMVDVDGEYFRFKGRASEIINVAGLKVYPSEVENCLQGLDMVSNAIVYAKANRLVGQIVAAKVELVDKEMDQKQAITCILDHCKAHLDRFKVPREIEFVSGIGLTDRLKKQRG